jgi:hypothetical protein
MPDIPIEGILQGLTTPIIVEEPNHIMKSEWFMDYLDSPEGFKMSAEDRAVVALFVRTHYQFEVEQQKAIAAGFAEVAQEGMPQDPAVQAEQARAEAEAQKLQMEHQFDLELQDQKSEQEGEKILMQAGIDSATQDQEFENAKDLAVLESALAVGEAKAMPKEPTAKPKAKAKKK